MNMSRTAGFAASVISAMLVGMFGTIPAYALNDTNLDDKTNVSENTVAGVDDAMPGNPMSELPGTISEYIPEDATVVSEDLAVTNEGAVLNLETGGTVADPELIGTETTQPDPLAKTNGETFIPVEVSEVRDALGQPVAGAVGFDESHDDAAAENLATVKPAASVARGNVRMTALENSEYGPYWGTYNNTPAFFNADGSLFVQQAKGVVDVSEWQGTIDWTAAKNAGVEGAIIRISYGWNNGFDAQAKRNINECKRLGIPFGVYSYSYAYDADSAAAEGDDIVALLRQAGVSPEDLSYPVFYDLEKWTWTGHTPPADSGTYDGIVNTWYSKLQAAGYTNLSVYSYPVYLETALNSSNIHGKTRWVASYGKTVNFSYSTNDRGWQYTSGGSVPGINGRVDLNAFGNFELSSADSINEVGKRYAEYLGAPIGGIACESGSRCWRIYEKGAVDWSTSTGAHPTWGSIRDKWLVAGANTSRYGLPVSDPTWFSDNGGGWAQDFQYGSLHVAKDSDSVFPVLSGPIRDEYVAQGFQAGFLGWPVSGVESLPGGGSVQRFQHGVIVSDGGRAFRLDGDILSLWEGLGISEVGLPASDTVWWDENGGGWVQQFAHGSIHWTGSTGAVFVEAGPIQREYVAQGFQAGFLGWPVSGVESLPGGGSVQRFQHGEIMYTGQKCVVSKY